ncbi:MULTISPECIES: MobF family relaxase [Burkholderiaceae]|jgi:conjugative relaxase-like TrwC/TraI family protein|uniref:Conjugative relaxase n=3 Tax=Pseudomonadota TaxID=1224 RepID=A0AAW4QCH5_RALPI|nr:MULTISPECIES: MobF family relaxase [Burkholderiaceae]UCF26323.1 MAG: conjugative relaxase [Ralstonia sp.]MBA9847941.1 conjugative relaxase [Ralstonia pickettii]MBA9853375.1 conjugative relaxase [Ralstonia pickettii]MBA9920994.1 conjugative relaxase [Ralstonia pickettii]MBA9960496.1 conjugative relaxase [Ralstonia pickettii]
MISMNNVGSAGQALHYFSKDNYYTQDEGLEKSEWFGQGAAALGLSGQIERQDFFEILNGKVDGQELGKFVVNEETGEREREHRPGTDMTFSAPKSVSLLAEVAGNREVREAHEAAVKKALTYIESELAYTRQMKDGELESVKTGNLVVAMFRHNTSRELDPQTHTHAVIMNATKREDGEWRSLTNDEIWKAQRVVGAIYTGELASKLQELGYELRRTDEKGNFEVVGVTREQIEHYSQRRADIEASLKSRGVDMDSATAQDKEDATLMTRAKKVDVDHDALIADWKGRAQTIGLNLAEIQAKAEAAREQGGIMREDKLTGRQAMEFAAAHLIEREAVVSKEDLMKTALEHGVGRVSPTDVQKAFDKLEAEGHLVKLPDGNYTTAKMLGSERWALDQVQAQKGVMPAIMAAEHVSDRLGKAEDKQGFKYTDGQKEAITTVLTTEDRYVAVQGLAGTGKTTMLRSLKEMAQEQGYTVRGMAPTGAASKVLARETGIATDTVSMFQIKERQLQKDIEFAKQFAPDFQRKPEMWIVDESSFLSQRQKAQLDHMAAKAGAKVVYLGDTLQLQGVEAGKPFELAQKQGGIETAYMTEISRQKTPDLKAAVDIITGRDQLTDGGRLTAVELKNNARAFEHMDKTGMVKEVTNGGLIDAAVKDVLAMSAAERERTIVITAYNKDRHEINAGVRDGLKQTGEVSRIEQNKEIFISKGWTRAVTKEAQYYNAGDVVRFGRDYKQIDAAKGEYARVVSTDATRGVVLLQKENGQTIAWEPKKNNNVEVYDAERRDIAKGDIIRMTRNEGEFKNGEVARVAAIDGDKVKLELKQGEAISYHDVDLAKSKHWDYAYASTVHASQGATQHRAMFVIRAPEDENEKKQARQLEAMAKVFGNRSFYVGSTRASHELSIYTNDKAVAAKAVSAQQDKTSAVETLHRAEQARDKTVGVDR